MLLIFQRVGQSVRFLSIYKGSRSTHRFKGTWEKIKACLMTPRIHFWCRGKRNSRWISEILKQHFVWWPSSLQYGTPLPPSRVHLLRLHPTTQTSVYQNCSENPLFPLTTPLFKNVQQSEISNSTTLKPYLCTKTQESSLPDFARITLLKVK